MNHPESFASFVASPAPIAGGLGESHRPALPPAPRFDQMLVRAIDVLGSLVLLILMAPLMLLIAVGVYVVDPGPIFFVHRRLGRGGQYFPCLKFRSMVVDAQDRLAELLRTDAAARAEWERDHKLKNDPRITRLGVFLRKSSLDELPQLLNVLRGEMSLVGPRPIVQAEASRYGRYIAQYCAVRPGITGLWQISGRNNVSYRRRVALDVMFARRWSISLYLRVALLTVPAVVMARGSY